MKKIKESCWNWLDRTLSESIESSTHLSRQGWDAFRLEMANNDLWNLSKSRLSIIEKLDCCIRLGTTCRVNTNLPFLEQQLKSAQQNESLGICLFMTLDAGQVRLLSSLFMLQISEPKIFEQIDSITYCGLDSSSS